MAKTQLSSEEIGNVQRNDFDITTSGQAVITKVIAGSGVTISSTGVDAGTGDVTVNAKNIYNSDGTLTGDRNVNGNEGGTQHILNFDGFDTFHVQGANVDINSDYILLLQGGDGTQVNGSFMVTGSTRLQSSLDSTGFVNIGDGNGDNYYNRLSVDIENGTIMLGNSGSSYDNSYVLINSEDSIITLNSTYIGLNGITTFNSAVNFNSDVSMNGSAGTSGQILTSNGSGSIPSWTTLPTLASGTYTPTITNVTDVTASSVSTWQYMRVGNVVTVSGQYTITTATGHNTQATIRLSLPVATNFTAAYQLTGSSNAIGANDFGYTPQISADATNDKMKIDVFPGNVPQTYSVHATYLIN
jgi:hypothetical protein